MGRLFAEILLLLAAAGGIAVLWQVGRAILARRRERKSELQEARRMAMAALEARDRTQLNNVLATYGDVLPKRVRIDLKARAEDLLIDVSLEDDVMRREVR